jgi:hypothetical protein
MKIDFETGELCLDSCHLHYNYRLAKFLETPIGIKATVVSRYASDTRYGTTQLYDGEKMTAWLDLTFRGTRLVLITFSLWPTDSDRSLASGNFDAAKLRLEDFFWIFR